MTERETVQKPHTGAQANDAATPTNVVPCRRCKQPHSFRWNDPEKRHEGGSWADPVDGHAFRPMTAADQPTATLVRVDDESRRVRGVVGAPIFEGFRRLVPEESA